MIMYHEIFGLECTGEIRHGSTAFGGGEIATEKYKTPGQDAGGVAHGGREPREISFKALFYDDDDYETFLERVNRAYECAEIFPLRSDRMCYIGMASAVTSEAKPARHPTTGAECIQYEVDVKITCPESYTYGAAQGLDFTKDYALPYQEIFTNSGKIPGKLDFLYLSGKYDAATGYYTKDVDLIQNQAVLRLIDQMLVGDWWQMDRFGHVRHTWESDFPMTYGELQKALGGATYCDYGTGGSLTYQELFLGYSGKIIIPFFGPLPIDADGEPRLKFYVTQLAGNPAVSYAFDPDLTDLTEVDQDLVLGWNTVDIPYSQGKGFVAFGVTTDAESQITIREIGGEVRRYVAESQMVAAFPTEDLEVEVRVGEWSAQTADIQCIFREGYYY